MRAGIVIAVVVVVVGIALWGEFGDGITEAFTDKPAEIPHYEIVDVRDVSYNDMSTGSPIEVRRVGLVVLTEPYYGKEELRMLAQYFVNYYRTQYNVVWIDILPNRVYKNSLLDSLQQICGNDYYLTMAKVFYTDGFIFIPEYIYGSEFEDDCGHGLKIRWTPEPYYFER